MRLQGRFAHIFCLFSVVPGHVSGRVLFGRALGPNCSVRAEQHECITNPLFMEKECKNECKSQVLHDSDHRYCLHASQRCFTRQRRALAANGTNGSVNDSSEVDHERFVFVTCNKTCHDKYRAMEMFFAPGDAQLFFHTMLPIVYVIALIALLCYQLVTYAPSFFMFCLERYKKSEIQIVRTLVERGQALLFDVCENEGVFAGFGPHAIGQLYVCGYYVVDSGSLIGIMAVVVYLGPKFGLQKTRPRLLKCGYQLLTGYTSIEAFTTLLKDLVIHKMAGMPRPPPSSPFEHHQPIYVEGEMTCKKLAMLGVAALFIQSSAAIAEGNKRKKTALPSASSEGEERTQGEDVLLLVGRLLMAGLVCYVGFVESARVMWGELHDPPDGHDHLWPKILQLLVVLPFALGFKTKLVTQLLAVTLVLEAVTIWTFWQEMYSDMPSLFHSFHSKDHFATNIAVAGGLFLLQEEGGGKYTLDAYMKKKD